MESIWVKGAEGDQVLTEGTTCVCRPNPEVSFMLT